MSRFVSPLLLLMLLIGCKAGPDYARPESPAAASLASGRFLRAAEASAQAPLARWWLGLGDDQLSALIDKGLADAPAMAAMQARVMQARAGIESARAAMLPTLGGSVTHIHADLPGDALGGSLGGTNLYSTGFDTQWEFDLWGGRRRGLERSLAQAAAAEARLSDAQVTLSAEIARRYVELRARQARAALLARRHGLETRSAGFARSRHARGTAPRQAVEAAELQLRRTEAEQAGVAAETMVLRDTLALLTGAAPGDLDALSPAPVPMPPREVAIGDPAALLARRPDLRVAERQLAAASAQIGLDEARRFPSVSIMGLVGIGGSGVGDMFDPGNVTNIILPRLTWNFLDFGKAAAVRRGNEAARDSALAEYRGSVLAALHDAETALTRFGAARSTFVTAGRATAHFSQIARLQAMRVSGGTLPAESGLEAQRQLVDAELAQAAQQADVTLGYIALAKALGLGWEAEKL